MLPGATPLPPSPGEQSMPAPQPGLGSPGLSWRGLLAQILQRNPNASPQEIVAAIDPLVTQMRTPERQAWRVMRSRLVGAQEQPDPEQAQVDQLNRNLQGGGQDADKTESRLQQGTVGQSQEMAGSDDLPTDTETDLEDVSFPKLSQDAPWKDFAFQKLQQPAAGGPPSRLELRLVEEEPTDAVLEAFDRKYPDYFGGMDSGKAKPRATRRYNPKTRRIE